MTGQYYIEDSILLSQEQVDDLIELDSGRITTASQGPLQTLFDLNDKIVSQLANHCARNKVDTALPLCITVTALSPLTGKLG
ncbi:hypothetical protein MNBD_GAMMA11-345 [hydrothermal vent metagenome]|uniref:Uncharacterized protein n=1 Tax=hydrothermal vent metagenome TaxID=652676 RepID=A0A3B0XQ17_9ZZZZ